MYSSHKTRHVQQLQCLKTKYNSRLIISAQQLQQWWKRKREFLKLNATKQCGGTQPD